MSGASEARGRQAEAISGASAMARSKQENVTHTRLVGRGYSVPGAESRRKSHRCNAGSGWPCARSARTNGSRWQSSGDRSRRIGIDSRKGKPGVIWVAGTFSAWKLQGNSLDRGAKRIYELRRSAGGHRNFFNDGGRSVEGVLFHA